MKIDFRLIAGDFFVLLLFGLGGITTHNMSDTWPVELVRILTPFAVGYFAVVFTLETLRPATSGRSFALSTVAGWAIGISAGLALRSLLEGSLPLSSFVAVTYAFTGAALFLWHGIYWFTLARPRIVAPRVRDIL